MAILTSGQISIGTTAGTDRSITGEFGGTEPHALSEYKRGGTFVPDGPTQNANIPTTNSDIAMSDFYGSLAATPITVTHYMRNNSSLDTIYVDDEKVAGIILGHTVMLQVRMYRSDPYVYLQARTHLNTYDERQWYNTSGQQQTFPNTGAWTNMGRFEETGATAIKMDWTITTSGSSGTTFAVGDTTNTSASYAAVDNTYQSISNNQSIGATFSAMSAAECYASNARSIHVVLNGYMQKTGKQETPLGPYRIQVRSISTSNNCQ